MTALTRFPRLRATLMLCALLLAPAAFAQAPVPRADAWVSSVQMPAWLERAGERQPLVPATVLRPGDAVITGAGGRAQLRMAEGSTIKLGESGRLAISDLRVTRGSSTILAGLLEVAQGAFRFTTSALNRTRSERDLQIRIATVTAGIRGTDLWGRGNAEREIVCLIEGRITVTRGSDAPITMSEPLSFYIAPVGAPALPLAAVDPKQLAQWAAETELVPGAGAATMGGRFHALAATRDNQDEALQVYDALRTAGFAAVIRPLKSEAGLRYEVRIANLPSAAEANALAKRISTLPGMAPASPAR